MSLLVAFALRSLAREPSVRIEDLYKWLFHAARGWEHAAPSREVAAAWLRREWTTLGPPRPGERLLVPLRPDGRLARLNLRPARAAGWTESRVLDLFLRSARGFRSDGREFVREWRSLRGRLPWRGIRREDWSRLDARTRPLGYRRSSTRRPTSARRSRPTAWSPRKGSWRIPTPDRLGG